MNTVRSTSLGASRDMEPSAVQFGHQRQRVALCWRMGLCAAPCARTGDEIRSPVLRVGYQVMGCDRAIKHQPAPGCQPYRCTGRSDGGKSLGTDFTQHRHSTKTTGQEGTEQGRYRPPERCCPMQCPICNGPMRRTLERRQHFIDQLCPVRLMAKGTLIQSPLPRLVAQGQITPQRP